MTEEKMSRTALQEALREGALNGCAISEMNCRELEWGSMTLRNCGFENVHLGDVDFKASEWASVTLQNVIFRGATGPDSVMESCFQDTDLVESIWDGAKLQDCSWHQSNLANASFRKTQMTRCDFQNVDLARLAGRGLTWFGGGASDAGLGGANLMGADLSGSILCSVSLRNANLCGANLSDSLFLGVDLTGAELSRASLEHAVWIGCRTDGIQWEDGCGAPSHSSESFTEKLAQIGEERLIGLVVYMLSSGALLTTGGAGRIETGLPVPAEYFSASYERIMETLKMRLPHPEWGRTERIDSHDVEQVTKQAAPTPISSEVSDSTPEEPAPFETDPDGGRFSLLEID